MSSEIKQASFLEKGLNVENAISWICNCPTSIKVASIAVGAGLLAASCFSTTVNIKTQVVTLGLFGTLAFLTTLALKVLYRPQPLASSLDAVTLERMKASNPVKTFSPFKAPNEEYMPPGQANPLSRKLRALNNPDCEGSICGVYLTSNESGVNEVRKALQKKPHVSNSCHIGFSGWHNFDIMSVRKSTYGLICDFNPDNRWFIQKTLQIVSTSSDRKECVEKLVCFIDKVKKDCLRNRFLPPFSPNIHPDFEYTTEEQEIRAELAREASWLGSDESFQYIKGLVMKDRIVAITTNILETEKFQKIAKIYQDNSIEIDSLYLTNISGYIKEEDEGAYVSTVHAVSQAGTMIIHCINCDYNADGLPVQKIDLGKPSSPEDDKRFFSKKF